MSVSNISSQYGYYQTGGGHQQRKQEIDALSQALQSGDLSSAQQAFSSLFNANSTQSSTSSTASGDGIVADISALGKALSSGDLTSAQSAFSTLQSDIQNAPPPPGGPNSAGGNDQAQQAFSDLATALQSGDLSAAQTAFATLQALAPNQSSTSTASTSGSDSANPFSTDITALSDALSSGNLSSAQSAFAQLQKDIQNAPPPPPSGPNGGGSGGNGDQVQQAFSNLASALQSGDLSAAQTAFATLQTLASGNPSDSTTSSSSSTETASTTTATSSTSATTGDTIGTDLSALSNALQSGDLNSAQSLFQTLIEDLQANAKQHPGMHHYAQNSTASSNTDGSVSVSA